MNFSSNFFNLFFLISKSLNNLLWIFDCFLLLLLLFKIFSDSLLTNLIFLIDSISFSFSLILFKISFPFFLYSIFSFHSNCYWIKFSIWLLLIFFLFKLFLKFWNFFSSSFLFKINCVFFSFWIWIARLKIGM